MGDPEKLVLPEGEDGKKGQSSGLGLLWHL